MGELFYQSSEVVFGTIVTKTKIMTGTIKKIVGDRGFGFIAREGEAKDLFFHSKDLNGVTLAELHEGDVVSFEVTQSEKGPNAVNVQRAQ